MKRRHRQTLGQGTLELAMLIPILFALLAGIILVFRANHEASDHATLQHSDDLRKFNHGNPLGDVVIKGVNVSEGRFEALIPAGASFNIGDVLLDVLPTAAFKLGLNEALAHIPFLDGTTYIKGFARGFTQSALGGWADSGFTKMDLERAGWMGLAGAFTSNEASKDFQGDKLGPTGNIVEKKLGGIEPLTAGVQCGFARSCESGGSLAGFVSGFVSGALNSDTAQIWFEQGNEILKSAARGALTTSISGLASGGDIKLRQVLVGAATGALNTKTVAQAVSFGYSGSDARNSASYGATNAALSALLTGGNLESALYAASSGAFFSGQTMGSLGVDSGLERIGASTAYQGAIATVKGEDLAAVGYGALISTGIYGVTSGIDLAKSEVYDLFDGSDTPEEVQKTTAKEETLDKAVDTYAKVLDSSKSTNHQATAVMP